MSSRQGRSKQPILCQHSTDAEGRCWSNAAFALYLGNQFIGYVCRAHQPVFVNLRLVPIQNPPPYPKENLWI